MYRLGGRDGSRTASGPPESCADTSGGRLAPGMRGLDLREFAEALSSLTLSDLTIAVRGELLAVIRPACCGRRREFQDDQPAPRQNPDFLSALDFPLRSRYRQHYDPFASAGRMNLETGLNARS